MELTTANHNDLDTLIPLVCAYHEFEALNTPTHQLPSILSPLLAPESNVGRVWLIWQDSHAVGYIALCFGYSIEFGGRDAFIDEFFITEAIRGKGIGSAVLEAVKAEARQLDVKALHLEVAGDNIRARNTYSRHGFTARDRYNLMTCQLP